MRSHGTRTLGLVAMLAVVALSPAPAVAGEPGDKPAAGASEDASQRFRAGVSFYKDGDFAAALVEFKRAYELDPNYKVLFNLGQTSQELNDYASALSAFRRYLDEGGKEIDKARRAKVEGFVETLRKKVGTITIETNVPGAEISVDDAPVGKAPLEKPILVNAGRRKFSASLNGYRPAVRQEEIAGLDETRVLLELVEIETADASKEPPARREPEPMKPPVKEQAQAAPVAAWVMLSVTGTAAIATAVMGGLAVGARTDLDASLETFPGDATAIDDAQSKVRTFALATDILAGVTAACAVTTVILFVVAPGSGGVAATKTGLQVAPGSVVLRGAF